MAIALFSDIHGNLEALHQVLADARELGVTDWYCLGDIVGYGPDPAECVRIVQEEFCGSVFGNHEEMLKNARSDKDCAAWGGSIGGALKLARKQLGKSKAMKWIQGLPLSIEIGDMMLVHASPETPEFFPYIINDEDALAGFANLNGLVGFHGHTHLPAIWEMQEGEIRLSIPDTEPIMLSKEARYLINVGSVGQPRDEDPRACYVIYDPAQRHVTFRRVPYEIKSTQQRFKEAGLPSGNAVRLKLGH